MSRTIRIHGLPTSGKTTFARCARLVGLDVLDTDDVFGHLFPDVWANRHNDVLKMDTLHWDVGDYTYRWSTDTRRSHVCYIVSNLYTPMYIEGMRNTFNLSYYRDDVDEIVELMKQRKHGGAISYERIAGWIERYVSSSALVGVERINLSELRRASGVTKPQFISSTPPQVWSSQTGITVGINLDARKES